MERAQSRYDLDEALTLLGALEDARDALIDSDHLAGLRRPDAGTIDLLGHDPTPATGPR